MSAQSLGPLFFPISLSIAVQLIAPEAYYIAASYNLAYNCKFSVLSQIVKRTRSHTQFFPYFIVTVVNIKLHDENLVIRVNAITFTTIHVNV
jgi:hypothetical protein